MEVFIMEKQPYQLGGILNSRTVCGNSGRMKIA